MCRDNVSDNGRRNRRILCGYFDISAPISDVCLIGGPSTCPLYRFSHRDEAECFGLDALVK